MHWYLLRKIYLKYLYVFWKPLYKHFQNWNNLKPNQNMSCQKGSTRAGAMFTKLASCFLCSNPCQLVLTPELLVHCYFFQSSIVLLFCLLFTFRLEHMHFDLTPKIKREQSLGHVLLACRKSADPITFFLAFLPLRSNLLSLF